jgi:hypothetical protein
MEEGWMDNVLISSANSVTRREADYLNNYSKRSACLVYVMA